MKATDIIRDLPAFVKTDVNLNTSAEVSAKKKVQVVVLYSINAHSLADVQEKASRRDIVDLQNKFRDNLEVEEAIKWRDQLKTVGDLRGTRAELKDLPENMNNVKVVDVSWNLEPTKWFERPLTSEEKIAAGEQLAANMTPAELQAYITKLQEQAKKK